MLYYLRNLTLALLSPEKVDHRYEAFLAHQAAGENADGLPFALYLKSVQYDMETHSGTTLLHDIFSHIEQAKTDDEIWKHHTNFFLILNDSRKDNPELHSFTGLHIYVNHQDTQGKTVLDLAYDAWDKVPADEKKGFKADVLGGIIRTLEDRGALTSEQMAGNKQKKTHEQHELLLAHQDQRQYIENYFYRTRNDNKTPR